jgi:hypothetical protein
VVGTTVGTQVTLIPLLLSTYKSPPLSWQSSIRDVLCNPKLGVFCPLNLPILSELHGSPSRTRTDPPRATQTPSSSIIQEPRESKFGPLSSPQTPNLPYAYLFYNLWLFLVFTEDFSMTAPYLNKIIDIFPIANSPLKFFQSQFLGLKSTKEKKLFISRRSTIILFSMCREKWLCKNKCSLILCYNPTQSWHRLLSWQHLLDVRVFKDNTRLSIRKCIPWNALTNMADAESPTPESLRLQLESNLHKC